MNLPETLETAMSGTEKWMLDWSSTASYSGEAETAEAIPRMAASMASRRMRGSYERSPAGDRIPGLSRFTEEK